MVYYLTQPYRINQEQSFEDFMSSRTRSAAPQQTEAEIMSSVKDILSVFEGG